MATNSSTPEPNKSASPGSALAKYSGIAVQMVVVIGLSAWAGIWLDGHFHTKTPWYTIGLMVAGVVLALYQVIRSLTNGE